MTAYDTVRVIQNDPTNPTNQPGAHGMLTQEYGVVRQQYGIQPTQPHSPMSWLLNMNELVVKTNRSWKDQSENDLKRNKYRVYDADDNEMFKVYEMGERDYCEILWCTAPHQKDFLYHMEDLNNKEVLKIERPSKWPGRCCCMMPFCLDMECAKYPWFVSDPNSKSTQELGILRERASFGCTRKFSIYDTNGADLFYVACPNPFMVPENPPHPVISCRNREQVATITKMNQGFMNNFANDVYHLSFPMNILSLRDKTLIFSSIFLLDLRYQMVKGGKHRYSY